MRRHDREITEKQEIVKLIKSCKAIRLGLRDGERIYIVPLHFGYEEVNGEDVFYCHGAPVGRKVDLVKATGYAAYELDGGQELLPADIACDYSSTFFSIIGEAKASLVEDMAEKEHALNVIMEQYTGKNKWDYEPAMLKGVAVIKLVSTEMSCKAKART